MFAWLMKTPIAIKQIEKWSHGYLEMDCAGGKCYGVLAVSTVWPENDMSDANLANHRSTGFALHFHCSI